MTSEYLELQQRVARLEEQNRTLRRAAISLLVAAVAVVLIGQLAPKQRIGADAVSANKIHAKTLVVEESLSSTMIDAKRLDLENSQGNMKAALFVDNQNNPALDMYGIKTGMMFTFTGDEPGIALYGERLSTVIAPDGIFLESIGSRGKKTTLSNGRNGPSLELEDDSGYKTIVGHSGLVTPRSGETHQTSAASLVLFDKDQHVIWKAP